MEKQSVQNCMEFEPSRHFDNFHVAGFSYYDGLEAADQLKPGVIVDLVREVNNPYDPNAVVIRYNGIKLGYIPRGQNHIISQFLYFGHADLFEARVQRVDFQEHPEQQIRIGVKIRDAR